MAKDPGFLFYPGDYLRDTQCLSEKAQVAYDRIMCEHMRNICITQDQLNFFTKRLSEDEKMELMMVVVKKDCGYQIEWVAESICKRKEYSASRRKNRSSKGNNISDTYDSHMDNENENVIEDDKIEKEEKFNFKKSMVSYGFSERLVSEWAKVRKAKSLVNTETAFKKFIAEVEKGKPESLDKLLEDIVSRSWGGFKWEWLKNEKLNNNGRTEQVERKSIEHKKDFTGGFR